MRRGVGEATAAGRGPRVAVSKRSSCHVRRRARSSAVAKCVMSVICADVARRLQARERRAAASPGAKPRRFMPVLILRNTSTGALGGSRLQHAQLLRAVHHGGEAVLRRASGSSRRSKKPSSSRMRWPKPGLAQAHRGVELEQRRSRRRRAAPCATRSDPVAVGVGLDHRQHARARARAAAPRRGCCAARPRGCVPGSGGSCGTWNAY